MLKFNFDIIESQLLDFKLSDKQREVFNSVIDFLNKKWSENLQHVCISGEAGTGKTQLCTLFVQVLRQNNLNFSLITPTHKSKNVLSENVQCQAITIHKLLKLQPNINILNLNLFDLKFIASGSDQIKKGSIWIIDECSMIDDTIYQLIVTKAKTHQCKIIWLGDIKQLYPVKQKTISKVFTESLVYELTEVFRQDVNSNLYRIVKYLRNKPLNVFKNSICESGSLYVYDEFNKLLQDKIDFYKAAINLENVNLIKTITYTNARIEQLNNYIRRLLFKDKDEYHVGEFLTGYDSCLTYKGQIENSADYIIKSVNSVFFTFYKAYKLKLYNVSNNTYLDVTIISRDISKKDKRLLAMQIEILRTDAIKKKSAKLWKKYYNFIESFLIPFDLIYEDRLIRKKSLDYGYCISTHKSQSSTYISTIVDMENILTCQNPVELRQLQYVALSRTRKDVFLYKL